AHLASPARCVPGIDQRDFRWRRSARRQRVLRTSMERGRSAEELAVLAKRTPNGRSDMSIEKQRLQGDVPGKESWKYWGPYLSERQWGTVREDYSAHGNAWDYFPHDHARSRAYRWGEDGLAGFSDVRQRLCLSLALWNGRDPILKERLFGLTN